MLQVVRFDPTACRFPSPHVPVRAGITAANLRRPPARRPMPVVADQPMFHHYRRARYALKAACRVAGVAPGTALVAPAYHCRTMLDAAQDLGAQLRLYRVDEALRPVLADVERTLDAGPEPARALLMTHYFGFAQDGAALRALCEARGVELIEDCSHAMVLDPALCTAAGPTATIGRNARIGVSSPYKFIPSRDGGLLWLDPGLAHACPAPRAAAWSDEWRAARELLAELLHSPRHLPGPDRPAPSCPPGTDVVEECRQPSRHYHPGDAELAALRSTRWIMARADAAAIASARRRHYLQWAETAATLPGARALMPTLADDTVPYMFPLLLERPETAFHALKSTGLPIWRWDEMVRSDCPVATRCRTALLHLPCHQGLTPPQLHWMFDTVRRVLAHA